MIPNLLWWLVIKSVAAASSHKFQMYLHIFKNIVVVYAVLAVANRGQSLRSVTALL